MTLKCQNLHRIGLTFVAAASLTITGCATGGAAYSPIIDSQGNAAQAEVQAQDLADCQELAETRKYLNGETKTSALLGAGVGALVGATSNNNYSRRSRYYGYKRRSGGSDLENAVAGAVVGAIVGGGSRALQTRTERKHIVMDCMAGRGHRVLG